MRELHVMHGGAPGWSAAHRASTIDTSCVASNRSAFWLLGYPWSAVSRNLTMIDLPPLLRAAVLDRVVGGRRSRGPLLGAFNIRRMVAIGAILLFLCVGGHALGEYAIGSLGGGFSCDFSHSKREFGGAGRRLLADIGILLHGAHEVRSTTCSREMRRCSEHD